MRSLHGIHVHGFPNMYIVHPAQGANLISNVPHNLVDSAKTISKIVSHMLQSGLQTNEVTKQAEDDWLALLSTGMGMIIGGTECTPGYYNNEGHGWEGTPGSTGRRAIRRAPSPISTISTAWRNSGNLKGSPSLEGLGHWPTGPLQPINRRPDAPQLRWSLKASLLPPCAPSHQ
jgi:hypothetical protein